MPKPSSREPCEHNATKLSPSTSSFSEAVVERLDEGGLSSTLAVPSGREVDRSVQLSSAADQLGVGA